MTSRLMPIEELRKTAFAKWLKTQDRSVAAEHLADCIFEGETDSLAWDLLAATGEREYTAETFLKAVDLIQGEGK